MKTPQSFIANEFSINQSGQNTGHCDALNADSCFGNGSYDIPYGNINQQRRSVLKSVACVAAVSAIFTIPGFTDAVAQSRDDIDLQNSTDFYQDKVLVEFSDPSANAIDGKLARVSISNHSDQEICLHHLSPGVVSTRDGVYNINARLANGPVRVGPNGTYHYWINPLTEVPAEQSVPAGIRAQVQLQVVTGYDEGVSAQQTKQIHAVIVQESTHFV